MVDEGSKLTSASAGCLDWIGSQANFVAGKSKSTASLERLAGLASLYAVGPLERGRGEILIYDGVR